MPGEPAYPNRPRIGTVVAVRLSRRDAAALHDEAERRGSTISQVAHEAITRDLGVDRRGEQS